MRPSRVIIVTPRFSGRDGISAVARQCAAALQPIAGERDLEIWSLGDAERPSALQPDVTFRGAGGRRVPFVSLGLRHGGSFADALIVVTHVHLLPVVLPLIYRGASVVPVLEGIEAWKPLRVLELRALLRAYRVLAISQHTIDRFKAANPSCAGIPVHVCNPAVPDGTPPVPARAGGRFALIVARMAAEERYKGHDLLLQIWPYVRRAVPDAELIVVGDGDDRERLQAHAARGGLCDQGVRFAGPVDDPQLAAYYRDAAFFVMPSRDEGFGLVFLEAMRAGTPCIAARGAAEEVVRDQVDGLIVAHDDAQGLLQAMVRLFTDATLRRNLGDSARARVEQHFAADHFTERLHRALQLESVLVPC